MFRFKQFHITDEHTAMKIGTDGVMLGAWALQDCAVPHTVLDAGCGSALISLMLAQRFESACITGIEIDAEATRDALINVDNSPWNDRIDIINGNFLDYDWTKVDAIVSNPPFFVNSLASPGEHRSLARHDNSMPLHRLIAHASELLNDNGTLSVVLPIERLDDFVYLTTQHHLDVYKITTVSATTTAPAIRVMVEAVKGITKRYLQNHISIKDAATSRYTNEYQQLTHQFYLETTFH